MSHPYWPQPKYLYARSLPHGPYPAPMGDYGSRYTHGSFSRVRNYALPTYVASERTGLEGDDQGHPFEHGSTYYGFGDWTVGNVTFSCDPNYFIDKLIEKVFQYIPDTIAGVDLGITKVSVPNPVALLKVPIQNALKGLVEGSVRAMMTAAANSKDEFRTWFYKNISYEISGGDATLQGLINTQFETIWTAVETAIRGCLPSPPPPTYGYWERRACLEDPSNRNHPDCLKYFGMQTAELHKITQAKPQFVIDTKPSGTIPEGDLKSQIAARGGLQLMPGGWAYEERVAAAEKRAVVEKKGLPTAAVIGAAALAALLLLR